MVTVEDIKDPYPPPSLPAYKRLVNAGRTGCQDIKEEILASHGPINYKKYLEFMGPSGDTNKYKKIPYLFVSPLGPGYKIRNPGPRR